MNAVIVGLLFPIVSFIVWIFPCAYNLGHARGHINTKLITVQGS